MSIKPGASTNPSALMVRSADPETSPTSTICPLLTPTDPCKSGAPVPSQIWASLINKDRSINKCRMIREGAIIPFGQQGVKDDFQVVLHVGCRIAARFIQTPHHVHRRS